MALKIENLGPTEEYVYDISLDGSVVNALGMNLMTNTDGFNFALPEDEQFRYTDEHPYEGKGLNRLVEKGKKYTGYVADVMEFNDLYMRVKNGLDIDEVIPASINVSRKNYLDLLDDGSIKKVGNTLKSRKMSGYIKSFLDVACEHLLKDRGCDFLNLYYKYIDDIFNYRIPLRDIASKGKIKKRIDEYVASCEELTKGGTKKARQAWYELVIEAGMKVELDDTIYYVNTGTSKGDADVVKKTNYYVKGENGDTVLLDSKEKRRILTAECEKQGLLYKGMKESEKKRLLKPHIVKEEDVITLNCKMVPTDIIESEESVLCNDEIEYNVQKYIDQFNSRIRPLLVCFHPDIRDSIIITNPNDRPYFTEEECKLVSGYPMKQTDQDDYDVLMTPEKKEIAFWLSINERPLFTEECGIDWDATVEKYLEEKKIEDEEIFKIEDEKYMDLLSTITEDERESFIEDGKIPNRFDEVVKLGSDLHFYFVNIPGVTPSTGGDVIDDFMLEGIVEDDEDFE